MPDYTRPLKRFLLRGVHLNIVRNLMPEGFYSRLENVWSRSDGTIEARPGLAKVNTATVTNPVHSIKRINDAAAVDPWTRLWGVGTALFRGKTAPASVDTGYSGDPLTMIPWRPSQSPTTFGYVYDRTKLSKIDITNARVNQGIAPPVVIPRVEENALVFKRVTNLFTAASWVKGGTAVGSVGQVSRVDTTIGAIVDERLPYGGNAQWHVAALGASPFTMPDAFQPGMTVFYDLGGGNQENVLVDKVYPEIPEGTSFGGTGPDIRISSITYESGSTGWAHVVPTEWHEHLVVGALLDVEYNISPSPREQARIAEIHRAPDGNHSIRIWLVNTHATNVPIRVVNSYRAWSSVARAVGITVKGNGRTITIENGIGFIEQVEEIDLSSISDRALDGNDLMHISIKVDDETKILEGRVILDCDQASVSGGSFTGSQFTNNFFWKAFRASDLTPAIKGEQTVIQTVQDQLAREQLEKQGQLEKQPGLMLRRRGTFPQPESSTERPLSGQLLAGESQWTEFSFRLSALTRVGSDRASGLTTIKGVRIELTAINAPAGSGIVLGAASLYVRGSYGIEVARGQPGIEYMTRGRNTKTGVKSNPSPQTSVEFQPLRNALTLITTVHPDAQVDVLDIFRVGGGLPDWRYVGTIENTGAPSFTDEIDTLTALQSDAPSFDQDEPFTTVGKPQVGKCTTSGSIVDHVSGNLFSTSWKPGTIIQIGEQFYTLHRPPLSTTQLFLNESAGKQTSADFRVRQPELMAQPLPFAWGPFNGRTIFAIGDPNAAGTLYWTKGNDPDAHPSINRQEITSPSEPLIGGLMYEGRSYVFSSERLFAIYPLLDGTGWNIQERPVGRGLWSRWALTAGKGNIYFLSRDGIFRTAGGPAESITDDTLWDLFPHQDKNAKEVNGFKPVDMTSPLRLRLSYHSSYVYFDYLDTSGAPRTMVYNERTEGWLPYDYGSTAAVHFHRHDEAEAIDLLLVGGNAGFLFTVEGITDDGAAINCEVRTGSEEVGDFHAKMLVGDIVLDADPQGQTINLQPLFDDETSSGTVQVVSGTKRDTYIVDGWESTNIGTEARNVSILLSWIPTGFGGQKLFGWVPSAYQKPEDRQRRVVEWQEFLPGGEDAFVFGVRLWVETYGSDQTIEIWNDGAAVAGLSFTVNTTGEKKIDLSWAGFRGRLGRIVPTSTVNWRLHKVEWLATAEPTKVDVLDTNWRDVADGGAPQYVTGIRVEIDTFNVLKTLIFEFELEGVRFTVLPQEDAGSVTHDGWRTKTFTFNPPIQAHRYRVSSTDGVAVRRYEIAPIAEPEPHFLKQFGQNWDDAGFPGDKYCQGIVIQADTRNQTKTVLIERPDGTSTLLTINHNGRDERPYSFPVPFVAGMIRVRATNVGNALFYGYRLIWQPIPLLANHWETQPTSLDIPGYGFIRRGFISYMANAVLLFRTFADGKEIKFTLAANGSPASPVTQALFSRPELHFPPNKGKLWRFTFDCGSGVRIYRRDSHLLVKPWGSDGGYVPVQPFGGLSRETGVEI